jgi:hypothetical protein
MEMIKSRNETSHTYNEDTTKKIVSAIQNSYYQAFVELLAYSGSKLPPIPDECCHPFHFKAATDSG